MAAVMMLGLACAPNEPTAASGRASMITVSPAFTVQTTNSDRADEAYMRDFAAELPGFAGIAVTGDGEVSLLMTDSSDAPRARSVAAARIGKVATARRGFSTPIIRVRTARFTFRQLAAWRDSAKVRLQQMRGWAQLDLNEAENRIDVGVLSADGVAEAQAILAAVGVPSTGFSVSVVSLPIKTADLLDRMRPLRGGLGIGPPLPVWYGFTFNCTMALVAKWGGVPVILTNSHCTQKDWGLDSHPRYLSQAFEPGFKIGPEYFDRTGRVCAGWNTIKCRRADIALYSVDNIDMLPGESSPYAIGQIARPVASQAGSLLTLSTIAIDTANPLQVVGVREFPIQGELVQRIGATSGWQYGNVTVTCADMITDHNYGIPSKELECQSKAVTNSNHGDSGGPVFILVGGNDVLFAGINWGSGGAFDPPGTSYFSSVQQIRSELYQNYFEFFVGGPPLPPPPPAYYVGIAGATEILPQETCTWHASTTMPNPTYFWLIGENVVGTDEAFSWNSSSSFELVLEVHGGGGEAASTSLSVSVSSQADQCFDQ